MLLWRLMTTNQQIFEAFTGRDDFHSKVVVAVLVTLDQAKHNPKEQSLMYLCIFMLLNVSGSRELAMAMNQPFNLKIKFDLP